MPAECKFVLTKVAGIEQDAEQHDSAAQACKMICLQMQQALVPSSHAEEPQRRGFRSGSGQWQPVPSFKLITGEGAILP